MFGFATKARKTLIAAAAGTAALLGATAAQATPSAAIVNAYSCPAGTAKIVRTRGVEDNFAPGNDPAVSYRTGLSTLATDAGYSIPTMRGYDDGQRDRYFYDHFAQVPNGVVRGLVVMGMRQSHHNDALYIGNARHLYLNAYNDLFGSRTNQINGHPGWQQSGDLYIGKLEGIQMQSGATLLDFVNTHSFVDFVVQDDTPVDFITMVFCRQ